MGLNDDIAAVFAQEATGYLQRLRADRGQDAELRRTLAKALEEAAAVASIADVVTLARTLQHPLDGEAFYEVLAQLERVVGRLNTTGGSGAAREDGVTRPNGVSWDEGWNADTAELLRKLFAEEARDHLEVMNRAAMLLGADPSSVQEILRRAHTLKGAASTVGMSAIGEAAHELETRCIELRNGSLDGTSSVEWMLRVLDSLQRLLDAPDERREDLHEAFRQELATSPPAASAKDRQERRQIDRRLLERRREGGQRIRVDVERIEELMNAVGQLVVDRTRVERRVEELKGLGRDLSVSHRALRRSVGELSGERSQVALDRVGEVEVEVADALANLERATRALTEDSDNLGRTTRGLKEHLTRLRMMPMSWVYARLQRPVREAARSEGKRVELVTKGESAEMDRSVVEQISDPLIHLVRNAIAHGIELPAIRRDKGKPAVGLVKVTARHQGDMLFIEVEDDGAGLDPELLREAAGRLGLEGQGNLEQAADTAALIFTSGFSTRSEADGLAGRGVGLDVVRQNIATLSGDIRVTSRRDQGTRFSIRLPMTTSINQALLFKEAGQVYAIPVVYVVGTHTIDPNQVWTDGAADNGRSRLHAVIRDERLAVLRLGRLLGTPAPPSAPRGGRKRISLIELSFGDSRFGLVCTGKIVGPRELVLRRIGPLLGAIPLFAGATISGSGKVQLVLDVATLAEFVRSGEPKIGELSSQRVGRAAEIPRRTVLVVDDSRSIRELVGMILRDAGYAVEAVVDGWEAWQRLQSGPIDLLVTDLEMPRITGHELITRCRNDVLLESLPILVLTSRTAPANLDAARSAGADRCIKKPVNRRVILDAVRAMIGDE